MGDIWPTLKKMEGEWSQVIRSVFQTHIGGSSTCPGQQDN
jgi:hypothetical protein